MEKNISENKYRSREEEIREILSLQECIRRITIVYGWEYDPNTPSFDAWDQLLACEAVAGSTLVKENKQEQAQETNVNANIVLSGGCKRIVYFELTESKQEVIAKLTKCDYKTPPIKIASLLTELFKEWESKTGHWLYVAQHWNARAINRTINEIVKSHTSGRKLIYNPAGLFTMLIKFRSERRNM